MAQLKQEERMGLGRIQKLKRAYWTLFLSIPILIFALAPVVQKTQMWGLMLLILVPFVSGIVIQQKLIKVRCPRCGEPFFYLAPVPFHATSIPSQQRCQHCQLSMRDL